MNPRSPGVAWYRFRATLRARLGGYLGVVVLIGLIGGVAMASIAAGRLTQSSYPTFLASTNPSDLTVSVFVPNSGGPVSSLRPKIARLPGVKGVRDLIIPTILPLAKNGAPRLSTMGDTSITGSLDGMFLQQDRLTATEGHLADPNRPDQIVMTAPAARLLGVHLGQVVPLGFYTRSQGSLPGFGTPSVKPRLRIVATLTGIVVENNEIIQDDIDGAYGFVVVTPALMKEVAALSPGETNPTLYGVQLDHGADVASIERAIVKLIPPGTTFGLHVTSRVVSEVELAVKPESVALGGFGLIAALVCLVIGTQAVSRQLRAGDEDRLVLRSLGAGPLATTGDGLIGILASVLVGSLVAVGVAIGLSPLSPLGPVRPVYPDIGVTFDWTVLGVGLAVLVGTLGVVATVLSYRGAPHRLGRTRQAPTGGSRFVRRAELAGTPVAGLIGMRFALEPGRGRTAVPVRSALVGAVLAVVTVVATLTFASSLHTLVATPPLYGWNWTLALNPTNDVPPAALKLLTHDRDVAAWSGVTYLDFTIDGQTVPVLIYTHTRPTVSPPILSGHGLQASNQIVLGQATLNLLHRHVGQSVSLSYGTAADAPLYVPPTHMVIVGTATLPAVGFTSFVEDHTSMGTGAMFSVGALPAALRRATVSPDPNLNGPELVFVRLRPGVSPAAGRADMQRIADASNKIFAADPNTTGDLVGVIGVQRPAQIVNYRSIGSTPVILAIGLAAGAVVALGLTLAASVRRRRRDLAMLRALGFTPGQLRAAVAWQATVAAVIGIIVGLPLGIVAGRVLWTQFARNLDAVPDPTVPVLSMVIVAIGALVFANLVAALPGRDASRTPTTLLLRSD